MQWKLAFVYVGAVIGAGFASGQEINQFFNQFGVSGGVGLAIAILIMAAASTKMIQLCQVLGTSSYRPVLKLLSGRAYPFFDAIYAIFLWAGLAVMLAGSNAVLENIGFGPFGRLATAIAVLVALLGGVDSVIGTSSLVVGLLIVSAMVTCGAALLKSPVVLEEGVFGLAAGAGVLYASYNLGFAIAVFAGFASSIRDRRQAALVGIGGSVLLGVMATAVFLAQATLTPQQRMSDLPMLAVAKKIGMGVSWTYLLVLLAAMYTTALANAFALGRRITEQTPMSWGWASFFVVNAGALLSFAGFARLIKVAYPLFGLLGLFMLTNLLRIKLEKVR